MNAGVDPNSWLNDVRRRWLTNLRPHTTPKQHTTVVERRLKKAINYAKKSSWRVPIANTY
jgi:hypothetical protein